jgi:hypothetical protein
MERVIGSIVSGFKWGWVKVAFRVIRELGGVAKTDEYTANALETLELAERTDSPSDKGRLLNLAERWLDLADRARKRIRSERREIHPLIKAKLGDDHTDA